MKTKGIIDDRHIDVIDGIRAVSVIIVLIFHFWQQTWIFPKINTPWLSFIKLGGKALTAIDFTPFARVGYLFVDMMVLLSGFLLCLPLARRIIKGEQMQSTGEYFRRRAARILPSYLFCVISLFIYESVTGGYDLNGKFNTAYALRDLFTHLTFTHMLRVDTYPATLLNVVLWTLAVEVWFYILYPLIVRIIAGKRPKEAPAKAEVKKVQAKNAPAKGKSSGSKNAPAKGKSTSSKNTPAKGKKAAAADPEPKLRVNAKAIVILALVAVLLVGLSHLYIYKYVLAPESKTAVAVDTALKSIGSTITARYMTMTINQLPAFFEVYAVGMVGALLYVLLANTLKRSIPLSVCATVASFVFIWLIVRMVKSCAMVSGEAAQTWQVTERLKLALVFMGFVLCSAFSAKWYRFIFSNGLMRFLSAISYNLYIWHQWLAVKIKNEWRLPHWEGDTPPNQLSTAFGKSWSVKYAIIITVAAFAAAILVTYLIEKPCARLILGKNKLETAKPEKKKK